MHPNLIRPRIKLIESNENGMIKRIEFHEPQKCPDNCRGGVETAKPRG
jgi:hypothetical protein